MADVKFYLKADKKNPEKTAPIEGIFHFNCYQLDTATNEKKFKRLKYYTGERIEPKFWDKKKQKVKESYTGHPEFNQRLEDIAKAIKDTYRTMINDGKGDTITPETLRAEVNNKLLINKKVVIPLKNKTDFFGNYIQTIIDEIKSGKRLISGTANRYKRGTIVSYQNTLNNLRDYEADKKILLRFSDITMKFYKKYLDYLIFTKGYAVNTIGCKVKNIKTFMKMAYEQGLTDNKDFEKAEFKVVSEESTQIYLSEQDILKLYNLDLTDNKRLETVRDIFIIGCYTGFRFSDLEELRKKHFNENTVSKTIVKTQKKVIIPLHWMVKAILEKYPDKLPKVISNQKMNEYLKELGELAGIDDIILITRTEKGLRYDYEYKKYELISVHTARRSFATNLYLNDVPTITIMAFTDHKTEKSFLKYIKVTQEEHANKCMMHPFFSKVNNGG